MIRKTLKTIVLGALGLAVVGGIAFGTDLPSYLKSSFTSVRSAAKDAVPVEFELTRARNLIDDIVPEMQAAIRTIAQQEVEIASLRSDIGQSTKSLADERTRVQKLRDQLATAQTTFTIGSVSYSREELAEELSRRFDRYREAEVILGGKERLLKNRDRSLQAAMQMLDRMRSQKGQLENQLAMLDGQMRLVRASATGSRVSLDHSKLAQAQKTIDQIKKQLDVAERVLAHEARFTEPMNLTAVDEKGVLSAVDEHFAAKAQNAGSAESPRATESDKVAAR